MNPSQPGRNSFIKLTMELIRQYQLLHESIPLGMSNTAVLYIAGINSGSTFFFFYCVFKTSGRDGDIPHSRVNDAESANFLEFCEFSLDQNWLMMACHICALVK